MTDVLAALRTVLLADADVAALCEARVWAAEMPKAEATSMPRCCVVICYAGGFERRATDPIVRPRADVYSYGETFHRAGQVDRAVYSALKALSRERVGEALIHGVFLAGGPVPLRDSDAGWPVMVRSMSVAADERAVE
jgi:hypothetical protein